MTEQITSTLWVEQNDEVLLQCVKCDQCDSVLFPPQFYGCEACGADDTHLTETLVSSTGALLAFTSVYLNETVETPYQLAEVETSAQQPVRGRLDHPQPNVGDAVVGVLREYDGKLQFVFVPQTED